MYSGNQNGADTLVERYSSLVKRIAQHLMARMPASVQIDDLLQAGIIGLLEASKNYDAGKGASFETFAGIRIRGAMIDEMRKGDWAPRSVHRNARSIAQAIKNVEARSHEDASDPEIAKELGVDINDYHQMLNDTSSSKLFSFDEIVDGDDEFSGKDQFKSASPDPAKAIEQADFKAHLAAEIANLPEREKLVLALYYDEELNLKEIGLILEVSESRVSQLHSQAAMRLRARMAEWSQASGV